MRPSLSPYRELAAISFSTATMLFSGQAAVWTVPFNRMLYQWQRRDAYVLVTGILLTAAVVFLGASVLRRQRAPVPRIAKAVAVLVVLEFILALVGASVIPDDWVVDWLVPLLGISGAAIALAIAPNTAYRAARGILLLVSPLGLIVIAQLLLWPSLDVRRHVPPARSTQMARNPVILILLDDWSLARSSGEDGNIAASLENLSRLAATSFEFRQAYSPGTETIASIPRLLYQESGEVESRDGIPWWRHREREALASATPTMLTRFAEKGYTIRVFGFYLPYRALVGSVPIEVHAEPNWPKRASFAGAVAWSMVRNLEFLGDPLLRLAGRRLFGDSYDRYWYTFNRRLEDSVRARLGAIGADDFIFAHFALPHSPFVFGADGSFQGDSVLGRMEASPSKYATHLEYVDRMIGRLLGALRRSGMYDSSLVVVTADHNWKQEPERALRRTRDWARHVPLIIKWPGQKARRVVADRTCLIGIEPILRRVHTQSMPPTDAEISALARDSCVREVAG